MNISPQYRAWANIIDAEGLNKHLEKKLQDDFYRKVEQSQGHYLAGERQFEAEDYKGAIKEYDLALQFAPKDRRIQNARKKAVLEIIKNTVKEQSEQAIERLELGDTLSARHEIQEILTVIPTEPILISQ